ncbi:MAG: Efflux ABC transporter, permease protein, partial [uncultured Pseudonocardia sp.]
DRRGAALGDRRGPARHRPRAHGPVLLRAHAGRVLRAVHRGVRAGDEPRRRAVRGGVAGHLRHLRGGVGDAAQPGHRRGRRPLPRLAARQEDLGHADRGGAGRARARRAPLRRRGAAGDDGGVGAHRRAGADDPRLARPGRRAAARRAAVRVVRAGRRVRGERGHRGGRAQRRAVPDGDRVGPVGAPGAAARVPAGGGPVPADPPPGPAGHRRAHRRARARAGAGPAGHHRRRRARGGAGLPEDAAV